MKRLLLILMLLFATVADAAPRLEHLPRKGRIDMAYEPGLESTARELQASADATLRRIADDLVDLPAPAVVHIQLVNDASSLAAVAPEGRGAPAYAIGVAYPDLGVLSVAVRKGSNVTDPAQTLRHELAHLALGAAFAGKPVPHWLHEGFAYQHSAEWSWDTTETLAGMTWMNNVIPLEQLDASFPDQELPAHQAYAESYDFVGYLSRRGRYEDTDDDGNRWPFRKFLSLIGNGNTVDEAAVKAYGRPLKDLFDEWQSDLSKRYFMGPIGLLGLAVWILCALLLTLAYIRKRRQRRRRFGEWEREDREREAEIARIEALLARHEEDAFDDPDGPPKLVN
ncbi:MAG TPA: hypothetical protein VMZ53_02955 [Kofleriaceae bacterium]|nr:hypothetical protein [Kofleriaceae bacterium]